MDPEGERGGARSLRVAVADGRGRRLAAARGIAGWLRRVAPARARGTVNVALVSDARMRMLNRRYRAIDAATDVLSFPTDHSVSPRFRARQLGATPERLLGDIVIARGVARRQAREMGHTELIELRVLALHGLLHLLGYDHERDEGQMRKLEIRLRRKGRLPASLTERSAASAR